jgi:hypothetical protein
MRNCFRNISQPAIKIVNVKERDQANKLTFYKQITRQLFYKAFEAE